MITVAATPSQKKIDPVLTNLLMHHNEEFQRILETKSYTLDRDFMDSAFPAFEFSQEDKSLISLLRRSINQRMSVYVKEDGPIVLSDILFELTYESLNLGEGKTPEDPKDVVPELVLRGIRKVYNTSRFSMDRDIVIYEPLPLILAPYIEYWIDKALKGELINFQPRKIDINVKNIIQQYIVTDYMTCELKRKKFQDWDITVICDTSGLLHSLTCPNYVKTEERGFFFNLDKYTMDNIIKGCYIIQPGPYVADDFSDMFVILSKPIVPLPCSACADNYLEAYGYKLRTN
jgi:hypothetical protein